MKFTNAKNTINVLKVLLFYIGVMIMPDCKSSDSRANQFTVNPIFNDGVILQRRQVIPIWGKARPGDRIKCRIAGAEGWTLTGSDGNYIIYLDKQEAGGAYRLQLENLTAKKTITVNDVYFGEVWLASGQSNMEITLSGIGKTGSLKPGPGTFHVVELKKSFEWRKVTPDVADNFSALAGYFGVFLQKKLKIPIGIILNANGGTCIETWMSRESLLSLSAFHDAVIKDSLTRCSKKYVEKLQQHRDDQQRCIISTIDNIGQTKGWHLPDADVSSWKTVTLPGKWNKQGYDFNGTLWYRKTVSIPAEYTGQDWELHLGRIDKSDISYFNGVKVGESGGVFVHETYKVLRRYKIPKKLVHSGNNVIAVRANSFVFDGGFTGPVEEMYLSGKGVKISIAGEWKCKVEQNIGKTSPCVELPLQYNDFSFQFDHYIRPIIPYAIRGVIWYQGESNTHIGPMTPPNSPSGKKMIGRNPDKYAMLMNTMIADWRYRWGNDFAFLQCQLAGFTSPKVYQPGSQWAVLREKQQESAQATGSILTQTYDLGDEKNIHPVNKKDLAIRLFNTALCQVYGQNISALNPELQSLKKKGSNVIVKLKNAQGLYVKGKQIRGFALSADGKKFIFADAVQHNETLIVSSTKVKEPIAIAYAWADNPDANLYNEADLPVVPFLRKIEK